MWPRRFARVVMGVLLLAACQSTAPVSRPRGADEGLLYLYLQPLREDARDTRLTLEAVSAITIEGREWPLSVRLRTIGVDTARRQRLLAAGPLPAGDYTAVTFRFAATGDQPPSPEAEGRDTGIRVDYRFTLRRGEGQVIAVAAAPATAGAPVQLYAPTRPGTGVMGFVSNTGSNDVSVFDKRTMQVFGVIATGHGPSGMALDQRARRLYVALAGEDTIAVVDVLSGRITDTIRLSPGDEPVEVALTPDGLQLLSVNRGSNTVSFMDAASRFEVTKLRVGNSPSSIIVDPTGKRAFVFGALLSGVTVIDIASRSLVRVIATADPGPIRGAFNRRGDRLFVIHEMTPSATVINPVTLTALSRFPVRFVMDSIKVDPGTDYVYLGGRRTFAVSLYDSLSFAVIDTVADSAGTINMTADVENNTLYLVDQEGNRVHVVERIRKRRVGELDVGDGPTWISVMGES